MSHASQPSLPWTRTRAKTHVNQLDELFFSGFDGAGSNMSFNGVAEVEGNGLLRLTNDSLRVLGHAFYSSPVQFKNSSDGKVSVETGIDVFEQCPGVAAHNEAGGETLEGEVALPETVAAPDADDEKKGSVCSTSSGNFDNYVHSYHYPSSSYVEKVSMWSSMVDDGDNDLEAGSASPLSHSGSREGR
ncbi:hypothetical protein NL676_037116 [Syzygium grande]|nr:hypothetical protein NL676_037116 [Syzygium grande]